MAKVKIDYEDGRYFATPVTNDVASALSSKRYCIVDVSDSKILEWEDFLSKSNEWNSYWRDLDNKWYKENYSE